MEQPTISEDGNRLQVGEKVSIETITELQFSDIRIHSAVALISEPTICVIELLVNHWVHVNNICTRDDRLLIGLTKDPCGLPVRSEISLWFPKLPLHVPRSSDRWYYYTSVGGRKSTQDTMYFLHLVLTTTDYR
jgi:hypothetical protein